MPLSFIILLIASVFMALANFLIRQTIEASDFKKDLLLPMRLGMCTLIAAFFAFKGGMHWNLTILICGIAAGLIQGAQMHLAVKCMSYGPSSFVLSFQNASSIIPPLIMASLFGETFGHGYGIWNLLGSILTAGGLFFAFYRSFESTNRSLFFFNLGLLICVQIVFFIFFQWFALLQRQDIPSHPLLFVNVDKSHVEMFMPIAFLTAFLFISLLNKGGGWKDVSLSKKNHLLLGVCGGIASGMGGKLFELSTRMATVTFENNLLFPLLAASQVLFCSMWARYFFAEKITWPALGVALFGIFIALYA